MLGGDNAGLIAPGLPDITGKMGLAGAPISKPETRTEYPSYLEGAFTSLEGGHSHWAGGHTANLFSNDAVVFNASAANSIYGNSNTVQPPTITLIAQIKF